MVTVVDFLGNLQKVDVKSITETIVKEKEASIVDLNRYDQIFLQGVDADGKSLYTYSPFTQQFYDNDESIMDRMGENKSRFDRLNMFWTGRSYHSFQAYVRGNSLYITADARARKLLIQNSSDSIFGLTDRNKEIVNWEIIAPELNDRIREMLL